jgi:hypothetical protein
LMGGEQQRERRNHDVAVPLGPVTDDIDPDGSDDDAAHQIGLRGEAHDATYAPFVSAPARVRRRRIRTFCLDPAPARCPTVARCPECYRLGIY